MRQKLKVDLESLAEIHRDAMLFVQTGMGVRRSDSGLEMSDLIYRIDLLLSHESKDCFHVMEFSHSDGKMKHRLVLLSEVRYERDGRDLTLLRRFIGRRCC
jgi:hypothetical protein